MMIRTIKKAVSEYYGINLDVKLRKPRYAIPKHVTIYLCRELTPKSYTQISRLLNYSDHTTAKYAMSIIKKAMQGTYWDDKRIQTDVRNIKAMLNKEAE